MHSHVFIECVGGTWIFNVWKNYLDCKVQNVLKKNSSEVCREYFSKQFSFVTSKI